MTWPIATVFIALLVLVAVLVAFAIMLHHKRMLDGASALAVAAEAKALAQQANATAELTKSATRNLEGIVNRQNTGRSFAG